MKKIALSNDLEIPIRGLGARIVPPGEIGEKMYQEDYDFYMYAINSKKCTMFDTSAAYGRNDEALGEAIRDSGKREEFQIITKISNVQQREGNIRKAFESHLKYLKMDYVDLYLIHWPQTATFINTYVEMEKMYREGLIKAIGVCNCNIHHIREIMQYTSIVPMVNQFEITPLMTQDSLVNYCKAFGIVPMAYSALGRMHDVLIKAEPIQRLSAKYKKTPAQIIMKWNEQLGRPALLQTRNKEHFMELFEDIDTFELEDKEIFWINSMNDNIRLRYNPDMADFYRL